jgi:iron-sulfur cluster repair protein YtfE (RIC family)
MRRSRALTPLSHQHHQGLFASMRLKRATSESAAEARAAFLDFFEREGARHFQVEEELLLPAMARHGEAGDPAIVRVLTEHVDLRRRAQDLAAQREAVPEELHELGERLESHIRHEERVLFPMIEAALPPEQLERLGEALARAEGAEPGPG